MIKYDGMNRCAYIFLDESGNFDFSVNGTRYFVLTSVSMRRPFRWLKPIDDCKYDCIEYGLDNQYFHCTDDNKHVRNKVFDIIGDHLDAVYIDSLTVEKRKVSPVLWEARRFYPEMLGHLLTFVLPRALEVDANEVIVITDTIPVSKKRQAVEKAVRTTLTKMLPPRIKYRILHHDSRSHYGLQVADYCCWAVFRKLQTGETTYFDRIRSAVRGEFDIFRTETRYYY